MADEFPAPAFMFQLLWQGRVVAGFAEVCGLETAAPSVADEHNSGLFSVASRQRFSPVTFRRGLILDQEFEDWVMHRGTGASESRRLPLELELLDEHRQPRIQYRLTGCFATAFECCADLEASGTAALECLTIDHQGYMIEIPRGR